MGLLGRDIKGPRGYGDSTGESRELWIVSYADMMTLLFGFFVILYSFSKIDERKFSAFGKQVAQNFQGSSKSNLSPAMLEESRQVHALHTLTEMMKTPGGVDEMVQKIEKTASQAQSLDVAGKKLLSDLDPEKVSALTTLQGSVLKNPEKLELALPDAVLFVSGTARLTPLAKKALQEIAVALSRVQDLAFIEITGHTDSAPVSPRALYPNNWSLSAARAGSVAEELIRYGVAPKKISARGLANLQPLFPEKMADGKFIRQNMEKNRRVQIALTVGSHDGAK